MSYWPWRSNRNYSKAHGSISKYIYNPGILALCRFAQSLPFFSTRTAVKLVRSIDLVMLFQKCIVVGSIRLTSHSYTVLKHFEWRILGQYFNKSINFSLVSIPIMRAAVQRVPKKWSNAVRSSSPMLFKSLWKTSAKHKDSIFQSGVWENVAWWPGRSRKMNFSTTSVTAYISKNWSWGSLMVVVRKFTWASQVGDRVHAVGFFGDKSQSSALACSCSEGRRRQLPSVERS